MTTPLPHQIITTQLGDHPQGRLLIDLDAVAANFRRLRELASPAECGAAIKANGYGIGAIEVMHRLLLEGCRHFFVAQTDEAVVLRQAAIPGSDQAKIYVLGGLAGAPASLFVAFNLIPVFSTLEDIAHWREAASVVGHALPAVLMLESGMNRLGLSPSAISDLSNDTDLLSGISVSLIMSHLACADDAEHPHNLAQLRNFKEATKGLPTASLSLANSAGIYLGPAFHFDLVRPGVGLYGGNPRLSAENDLQPVATVLARILQIQEIDAGKAVGYGATFVAERPTRIATIGVGYADGYPRCLGNKAYAFCAGQKVPLAGRVSMDLITLDISGVPASALQQGDWVEVLGPNVPLDELEPLADTISYELLTRLGPRYGREYKGLPKEVG